MNMVSTVFILVLLNVFVMAQRMTAIFIFNTVINWQQEKIEMTLAGSAFKH